MELTEAKKLIKGQMIYHNQNRNADGSPQRWKVNGEQKKWKRDPDRIKIPLKHGLNHYDYLTNSGLISVSLTAKKALEAN